MTLVEKTCTPKYSDRSANVFGVTPDCAWTNQFVLSRKYRALHAEISVSMGQTQSQQWHARLQKTFVIVPSCTLVCTVSLSVASSSILRLVNWNQRMKGKTRNALVAPNQDPAARTFVRLTCSHHEHEKSPCQPQKCHGVFTWLYWSREESRAAQTS